MRVREERAGQARPGTLAGPSSAQQYAAAYGASDAQERGTEACGACVERPILVRLLPKQYKYDNISRRGEWHGVCTY